jgi:hypothetical protein
LFENRVLRRIFGSKRDEVERSGGKYVKRNLISVLLTHYCSGDQIEKNDVGGPYRTFDGEERRIQGFGGET